MGFLEPVTQLRWMAALYVAPAASGQGLAGKLQRHVIDYARRAGFRDALFRVLRFGGGDADKFQPAEGEHNHRQRQNKTVWYWYRSNSGKHY